MYGDTAAGRKRVAQLREQGGDVRALAARLERAAIRVLETREQDYSLEDVFLAIVERHARDAA